MRLLSEHMPVAEMHPDAIADKTASKARDLELSKLEAKPTDATENKNLQLARQLQEYKTQLIQGVSSLPLTALWLIHKYDQISDSRESDEDLVPSSEIQDHISAIKSDFDFLADAYKTQPHIAQHYGTGHRLELSLKQFPFAFEDLVTIVDLMIHEAKLTLDSFTPAENLERKDVVSITKRFAGKLHWLDKCNVKQLSVDNRYDIAFLLNGLNDFAKRLSFLILAEKNWLASRQQLASANAKLVLFIANQYKGGFLDFEDLVQEGNAGLLKAVDRFKYQLGFQFSTYAGYWIRQAISRALSRSERVVRIPCGQIAVINRVFRLKDDLALKLGKEPDSKQLAEAIGLSQDEINNILEISQTSVPLESFDEDEEESFAPIDYLEQKIFTHSVEIIANNQLESIVNSAIKTLNAREAKIISEHFGVGSEQPSTLQEIGSELNLTRERVRQIQVVALNKIKKRYGELLYSFL